MNEENKSRFRLIGILLVLLGISGIFGSLTIAYLDSRGYWNCPKDFFDALFWNRGSEPIGLGIRGLQMFHYLIGGLVLLVSGGSLLVLMRSFAHSPLAEMLHSEDAPTQNLDELKEKIRFLEHEKENLRLKLWKYERRPSNLTGYIMLATSALGLISAAISSSNVLAFIGLSLALWGALLLYIRPTKYVKASLLTFTAASSLAAIGQEIEKQGMKGTAVYLPPEYLKEIKGGRVLIAKEKSTLANPEGLYLTAPGLSLANLYEEELGVDFAEVDLDYLQTNLPKLLTEDLEIAEKVEMGLEENKIRVRIEGSVYGDLCREIRRLSPNICRSVGCPLISSMALAIARSTGKKVTIEEDDVSSSGERVEASFRLLGKVETEKSSEAKEDPEIHPFGLVGLILSVSGLAVLAFVGWLTWYDMTVWGKDITLIFFGSRTGEAISLGIGMKVVYYLLLSLLLLASGILTFLRRKK